MAKVDSLSRSNYLAKVGLYAKWAPRAFAAFNEFAAASFADGILSNKEKEIIAVGCAHSLRCPYCIDYHIKLARDAGASKEELAESIWVAIAMGAGACFAHAAVAIKALNNQSGDFYATDGGRAINEFATLIPQTSGAYANFQHAAFADGVLSVKFKRLVAIACAHNTRCPFCIEHHVTEAQAADEQKGAIAEAIWVAIEMGAGACFGHAGLSAALLE